MLELNRIVLGDVLEVLRKLPDDTFDVGVTSPPYNKGERDRGWLVDRVVYRGAKDRMDEEEYQRWQIEVLNEIYRVTKPGGSFFYNHKLRWKRGILLHPWSWVSKTKWIVRQEIIWHRKIAANLRGWRFWQVDERIYWLYKPRNPNDTVGKELESRHALLTSVWEIPPEKENPHPAPFPIELPTRCIYSILGDERGVVLDPFAGSETTLVAAKILGKDFLGIEISEEYVKMANERLENAEKETARVMAEIQLHKVQMTFQKRKAIGKAYNRFKKNEGLF